MNLNHLYTCPSRAMFTLQRVLHNMSLVVVIFYFFDCSKQSLKQLLIHPPTEDCYFFTSTISAARESFIFLNFKRGWEVERLLHKLQDSTSVGSNLAWHQKDFRSNSNTTGGALVNNVQKLMRLSLLD